MEFVRTVLFFTVRRSVETFKFLKKRTIDMFRNFILQSTIILVTDWVPKIGFSGTYPESVEKWVE